MSLTEREWDIAQAEAEVYTDLLIQEVLRDLADDRVPQVPEQDAGEALEEM
jgi:hypothetical protein